MNYLQLPFDANPIVLGGRRRAEMFFTGNNGGTMRGYIFSVLSLLDQNLEEKAEECLDYIKNTRFPKTEKGLLKAIERENCASEEKETYKIYVRGVFRQLCGLGIEDMKKIPVSELVYNPFPAFIEANGEACSEKTYKADSDAPYGLIEEIKRRSDAETNHISGNSNEVPMYV